MKFFTIMSYVWQSLYIEMYANVTFHFSWLYLNVCSINFNAKCWSISIEDLQNYTFSRSISEISKRISELYKSFQMFPNQFQKLPNHFRCFQINCGIFQIISDFPNLNFSLKFGINFGVMITVYERNAL